MPEVKKESAPVGRPALIEVEAIVPVCAKDGEMTKKGQRVKVSREVAKKWQDAGVVKIVL